MEILKEIAGILLLTFIIGGIIGGIIYAFTQLND